MASARRRGGTPPEEGHERARDTAEECHKSAKKREPPQKKGHTNRIGGAAEGRRCSAPLLTPSPAMPRTPWPLGPSQANWANWGANWAKRASGHGLTGSVAIEADGVFFQLYSGGVMQFVLVGVARNSTMEFLPLVTALT